MTYDRKKNIIYARHPHYLSEMLNWEEWRDTFEAGEYYRDHYLVKFSKRETADEFDTRKKLTPIPSFAKAAVLDIRNSIYQRLVGVTRSGGSSIYQSAVAGEGGGVDGNGNGMDTFMGKEVLTDLLVMGKVGVYVDAAPPTGDTLADTVFPPFLTYYRVEDILSYTYSPRGLGGEFQAVLLRDWNASVEIEPHGIALPNGTEERYRLVWKEQDGGVYYKLLDSEGEIIPRANAREDGAVLTGLSRVPFVMLDIGDSVLKDVASYQKSLLNLVSNDVHYAIKSNSPFLAIQRMQGEYGDHLKRPEGKGEGHVEQVGAGIGRYYGKDENPPEYVSPPTDPLEASMKLQERLEDSIRTLVNLAVQSKAGSRTESAESKRISQGGLEAGLSFIGVVMEAAEKKIAQMWAEYENTNNPKPALINYPDRYTLKSDEERLDEASKILDIIERLPGKDMKKEAAKSIITVMLDGKVSRDRMDVLLRQVDIADYTLADPEKVFEAHKEGLVSDKTAAVSLGYDEDEIEQAREDHAIRVRQTLAAQTSPDAEARNPAARGAPDLGGDAEQEKEESLE